MDYNKIGNLIMTERKAKKITQAKLAEQLFVSEKTVSKWENGKGVPDTSVLPKLCEIFNISLNELLNGERVPDDEYVKHAENSLLQMQKQKEESDKRFLFSEIVLGIVTIISFVTLMICGAYLLEYTKLVALAIVMIVVAVIVMVAGMMYALYIEQKVGYYMCAECNHKHVPKYGQVLFSPHINRTRYMKCPKCKKRSWQKKVIK